MSQGPVEQVLNCLGYFGFGGGYLMAAAGDRELYCSAGCPLAQECWQKHRQRVEQILPALTLEYERLLAANGGNAQAIMEEWYRRVGNADPYTVVMGGNIEDGASVANCGCIVDRGKHTLPLPYPAVKRVKGS